MVPDMAAKFHCLAYPEVPKLVKLGKTDQHTNQQNDRIYNWYMSFGYYQVPKNRLFK